MEIIQGAFPRVTVKREASVPNPVPEMIRILPGSRGSAVEDTSPVTVGVTEPLYSNTHADDKAPV